MEGTFGLPYGDDEHVVAAVLGGAGVLVTHNVRDFPTAQLPAGLEVQVPSEFAHHVVSVQPAALCTVRAVSARSGLRGPSLTVEHVLELLDDRYGFTDAVQVLRVELGAET